MLICSESPLSHVCFVFVYMFCSRHTFSLLENSLDKSQSGHIIISKLNNSDVSERVTPWGVLYANGDVMSSKNGRLASDLCVCVCVCVCVVSTS